MVKDATVKSVPFGNKTMWILMPRWLFHLVKKPGGFLGEV